MDIKSKLGIYSKKSSSSKGKIQAEENREHLSEKLSTPIELTELIDAGGEKINTKSGNLWRFENRLSRETVYKSDILPENFMISAFLKLNGFDEGLSLDDLLFFDLETRFVSIAAGSYPFVVGLGYTDDEDFVCEQLFMESYADEPAILEYLLDFFKSSKAVVSFNGNTFDLPLIKNRYMMNRIYGFPVDITKIDLIVPSRRIFKSIYENCSLQTIEKNLLHFERVGDVPGYMIPEIYFTFQKDGLADRLPGVIEHNRYDIYSMYYLILILNLLSENIINGNFEVFEQSSLFTIARYLYRVSPEMFLDLAEYLGMDIIGDKGVFERFSITLKRAGEWQKAVEYWEKSGSFFSFTELAKYYEHKQKNYSTALEYCDKALSLLDIKKKEVQFDKEEFDKLTGLLYKRIKRLKQKIKKSS